MVGFDLEWKPNTQKYEQENRIALLQLSINDKVLMFHVSRCRIDGAPYFIDIESPLHELLVDSKYLKVGDGVGAGGVRSFAGFKSPHSDE